MFSWEVKVKDLSSVEQSGGMVKDRGVYTSTHPSAVLGNVNMIFSPQGNSNDASFL